MSLNPFSFTGFNGSGFNVRAGSQKSNSVRSHYFNSSHVFVFSVFNPDAIKDLKLYKVEFHQLWRSVLEYLSKDGSSKEFHVNGGID
jgi:hypothetical protein